MKKKLLVLCLVVMFVLPATVFAGGFLGLKVGATAVLNEGFNMDYPEETDFSEVGLESFLYGADVRLNISVAEIAALLVVQPLSDGTYVAGGLLGLGLSVELLGLVDLGVTAGPFLVADIDGDLMDPRFDPEDFESFPLRIRATADVNLGGFSVGGYVMIDPVLTIGDLMDPAFDPSTVEVDTTAFVGLSVLVSLL